MNIAFTSAAHGGLDSYVRLAAQWAIDHGHRVHIIYWNKTPTDSNNHNLPWTVHSAQPSIFHYYLGKLKLIRSTDIEVIRSIEHSISLARTLKRIHSDSPLDFVELNEGAFPFLLRRIPYIYKMHGAEWVVRHYCEDKPYSRFYIRLQRQMMYQAKQVIAISHSQSAFIAGACHFPPDKIRVVPLPSDLSYNITYNPSEKAPYYLMNVGRLERRKGIHTLVAALPLIWEKCPETVIWFFGSDGDYGKAQIERDLPPSVHQGRLQFHGFTPHHELIKFYSMAHLFVSPTQYESNGGYAIQEALSCGCPVIASDIGPVSELVRHCETGWLVERNNVRQLANTVISALESSDERYRISQNALKFRHRFELNSIMEKQFAIYEQALTPPYTRRNV